MVKILGIQAPPSELKAQVSPARVFGNVSVPDRIIAEPSHPETSLES